mmetsp:Transcript_44273/g.87818  ORF Transcript_44273/g.87818 Transcript_44273/m.87818 type:complete len:101 (-) Transcript_44273:182-484(-)|eukprot:CAMPEP_0172723264 /NCGR_PEP_ID=MMETSP1074-20121228/83411_1 /TAXON_ID=2916 /ORGANISM="Ceratium fusus, Strain PA161109" /LENGTH=100 /DNA_ID=CAMNT_0013549475 /DNA_START=55 /DNA_END=357 /DNA_ORIENTATION=+
MANTDGESKEDIMKKVIDLQLSLAKLSSRVDTVKCDNNYLRDENDTLRSYLENLMAKVSQMSNLGTTAPSRVKIQQDPDGAVPVRVSDHIGELTAPAIDD